MENYAEQVEKKLHDLISQGEELPYQSLLDAMRYSLLCGGKRVRPVLLLEFCALCGGDTGAALPFACAIEMVHTYSLIHDDLPCMDNDGMRRGRPSCHIAYGEDTALLAGDALLTAAFETMLSPESVAGVGAARAAEAACLLAREAGKDGMVGGQVIDLASEGKEIALEDLQRMDRYKTGALISAAAQMGCVLAGAGAAQREAARRFASALGLAFQIVDDILDVTGDTATLGKQVGSDAQNHKCTYVSLLGLEEARRRVRALTDEAIDALHVFPGDISRLTGMAEELLSRRK